MRFRIFLTAGVPGLLSACANITAGESKTEHGASPADTGETTVPPFVDDCTDADNDSLETLSGISTSHEGITHSDVQLCEEDEDVYRVDVAPGTWVRIGIEIDGSGHNGVDGTDLDLWEIEHPDVPIDPSMDVVISADEPPNIIWYSASSEDNESLAWANASTSTLSHFLRINGFNGATANYDIVVQTSDWHWGRECSDILSEAVCAALVEFPQTYQVDHGYLVSHLPHYSHVRRSVAYPVQDAAIQVHSAFPGTPPIELLDMSEADGSTPGTMEDILRHPAGTHEDGWDIDVAYYQIGSDNLARSICPDHDGSFCTGDATGLDPVRTAYFTAQLCDAIGLQVIAVDPAAHDAIQVAVDALIADGRLTTAESSCLDTRLQSGERWPKNHTKMHLSWAP